MQLQLIAVFDIQHGISVSVITILWQVLPNIFTLMRMSYLNQISVSLPKPQYYIKAADMIWFDTLVSIQNERYIDID